MVFSSDLPDNVQLETSAADNKACRGDVLSITCSADAVPSVTSYQLFENDIAILDTSGMWTRNFTTEGTFIYKCVANNTLETRESASVTVTVNGNFVSFYWGFLNYITVCVSLKKFFWYTLEIGFSQMILGFLEFVQSIYNVNTASNSTFQAKQ